MPNVMIIRSGLNPDLVLSVNAAGQVVLAWYDPNSSAQQWSRIDVDQYCRLVNMSTNSGMLAVGQEGDAIKVGADGNQGDLWSISGDDTYQAIRQWNVLAWNVNVQGGVPAAGTQLILYHWQNGAPNEIWRLQNKDDIPAYPTVLCTFIAGGTAQTIENNSQGNYIIDDQAYPPDLSKTTGLYDMTVWAAGWSFKNRASGKYVTYTGPKGYVAESAGMCVEAYWTLKFVRNNPSDGTPLFAIRPYQDADQNLNAFDLEGYPHPGDMVGTWDWAGGDANETWGIYYQQADQSWTTYTGSMAVGA